MYYIQNRSHDFEKWKTWIARPFKTAREAKAFLNEHGCKIGLYYRIVESYTVTRYKAVKI